MEKEKGGRMASHDEFVVDHSERLRAVELITDELRRGQEILFGHQGKITEVATHNAQELQEIKHTINNGIKDRLELLCKTIIGEPDKPGLVYKVKDLEENTWFNRFLDKSSRQIIIYIVMAIVGFIFMNNLTWGVLKTYVFGEKPVSFEDIKKNFHYHSSDDGTMIVHEHEQPDGPLLGKKMSIPKSEFKK